MTTLDSPPEALTAGEGPVDRFLPTYDVVITGHLVVGAGTEAVGKYWRADIEWRDVPLDRFAAFDEPGQGQIACHFGRHPRGRDARGGAAAPQPPHDLREDRPHPHGRGAGRAGRRAATSARTCWA